MPSPTRRRETRGEKAVAVAANKLLTVCAVHLLSSKEAALFCALVATKRMNKFGPDVLAKTYNLLGLSREALTELYPPMALDFLTSDPLLDASDIAAFSWLLSSNGGGGARKAAPSTIHYHICRPQMRFHHES